MNAGGGVCRMRQNKSQRSRVATGGKENPLKVWDLERPDKPIFIAKNVSVLNYTILSSYDRSGLRSYWVHFCHDILCVELSGRWHKIGWT